MRDGDLQSRFQAQCLNCPWKGEIRATTDLAKEDADEHSCNNSLSRVRELIVDVYEKSDGRANVLIEGARPDPRIVLEQILAICDACPGNDAEHYAGEIYVIRDLCTEALGLPERE